MRKSKRCHARTLYQAFTSAYHVRTTNQAAISEILYQRIQDQSCPSRDTTTVLPKQNYQSMEAEEDIPIQASFCHFSCSNPVDEITRKHFFNHVLETDISNFPVSFLLHLSPLLQAHLEVHRPTDLERGAHQGAIPEELLIDHGKVILRPIPADNNHPINSERLVEHD